MPRAVQSKSDATLASIVQQRFLRVAHNRLSRERVWSQARKQYDPSFVDRSVVRRPPYVKEAQIFRTVQTQAQNLLAATESNGRYVYAVNATPDTEDYGDLVTELIDAQFRLQGSDVSFGNEDVLERGVRGALLYGNSATYHEWFDDGENWGVRDHNIDLFDFFPDEDNQPTKWYIIRRYMPMSMLQDIALTEENDLDDAGQPRDGGRSKRVFNRILKDVKEGFTNVSEGLNYVATDAYQKQVDTGRTVDIGRRTLDDVRDPFNARVMVLQYFETARNGQTAMIVPGFGNFSNPAGGSALVMKRGKNPYGICQISTFTPNPLDNEFWGLGLGEILGGDQKVMSYAKRMAIHVMSKEVDAPLMSTRAARIRRDWAMSPSGRHCEVPDQQSVWYLPTNLNSQIMPFMLSFMEQSANKASGESEQRQGKAGAGSATEAAILEQSSQTNDRMVFRRYTRSIEQSARIKLKILMVHLTSEKAIPLVGRGNNRLVMMKPEFLKGNFTIQFGGSLRGQTPQQEVANINAFAATYVPLGVADPDGLARLVAPKIGIRSIDEVMMRKVGRPEQSADDENIAMFEHGQSLQVNPRDNHQEHALSHSEAARQLQQFQPDHPQLVPMALHIQEHEFFQQQQLMQQAGMGAQAAPQQGISAPGGTPASGGPGQTASLTPQQPNIDAARQQPNLLAAGGAPGGAVPGRTV